jgi:hypothetical protein
MSPVLTKGPSETNCREDSELGKLLGIPLPDHVRMARGLKHHIRTRTIPTTTYEILQSVRCVDSSVSCGAEQSGSFNPEKGGPRVHLTLLSPLIIYLKLFNRRTAIYCEDYMLDVHHMLL